MKTKSSIKIFLIPTILFAVFFAFGNEAKAAATTYYVDNTVTGCSFDSNGRAEGYDPSDDVCHDASYCQTHSCYTVFKHPQAAVNFIPIMWTPECSANYNKGDVEIIVADGEYGVFDGVYQQESPEDDNIVRIQYKNINCRYPEASDQPDPYWLILRAERKWGAILDGGNGLRYQSPSGGVNIAWSKNIIVEGFEIRDVSGGGIGSGDRSNNLIWRNNYIHHIARYQMPCARCSISGRANCAADSDVDNEERCQPGEGTCLNWESSYGHAGVGGDETTHHILIDSNLFTEIGRLDGGCSDRWMDWKLDHFSYHNGNYLTFTNNIFYQNQAGAVYITGNWGQHHITLSGNTFYLKKTNSAFLEPSAMYIQIAPGPSGDEKAYLIQNNIFYMPENQDPAKGPLAFYTYGDTTYPTGVSAYNNLVYGADQLDWQWNSNNKNFVFSGNIIGRTPDKNPMFVDFPNGNFRLQFGSPAIDRGVYIAGYTHDAEGNPIVGAPDIGAYEYVGVPPVDIISPAAPTGLTVQ